MGNLGEGKKKDLQSIGYLYYSESWLYRKSYKMNPSLEGLTSLPRDQLWC